MRISFIRIPDRQINFPNFIISNVECIRIFLTENSLSLRFTFDDEFDQTCRGSKVLNRQRTLTLNYFHGLNFCSEFLLNSS